MYPCPSLSHRSKALSHILHKTLDKKFLPLQIIEFYTSESTQQLTDSVFFSFSRVLPELSVAVIFNAPSNLDLDIYPTCNLLGHIFAISTDHLSSQVRVRLPWRWH